MQNEFDDVTQIKIVRDEKSFETSRENVTLDALVNDNEEELEEIVRKYKASFLALSSHQIILQVQSETIENYEDEKNRMIGGIEKLRQQIDLECEPLNCSKQKILLNKIEELERKLEFEETT